MHRIVSTIDYRRIMYAGQEHTGEKRYFLTFAKLSRLNDSIFVHFALHLGGEQDVVHCVTGLIRGLLKWRVSYDKVS